MVRTMTCRSKRKNSLGQEKRLVSKRSRQALLVPAQRQVGGLMEGWMSIRVFKEQVSLTGVSAERAPVD
jgi:hypothetical protein